MAAGADGSQGAGAVARGQVSIGVARANLECGWRGRLRVWQVGSGMARTGPDEMLDELLNILRL